MKLTGSHRWQRKHRVYDEQREFLGNYKTVLGKEEALQKVIGEELGEGLVSVPFAESELRAKYPRVLLNSLGAEMEDLTKPDVGTLVDETQGGVDRHIRLTMQPARPSLADALRIEDRPRKPAAAKWGGAPPAGASRNRHRNTAQSRLWAPAGITTRTPSALPEWSRPAETGAVSQALFAGGH